MARILDCKVVAQSIKDQCKDDASKLKENGVTPKLAIIRVGEKGPDLSYEKGATKTMEEAGIEVEVFALPADVSEEEYIKVFKEINSNPSIHGILPLRPLDNIDETKAISDNLSAIKDCDASCAENIGKVLMNDKTAMYPCTASAIMEVIDFYSEDIKKHTNNTKIDVCQGLNVCILNRSNVIGKPLQAMLTNRYATATIISRHTDEKTKDHLLKNADIVICAIPEKDFVTADMLSPKAIVIDATVIREKAFDENGEPIINEATGRQKINILGCCAKDVEEKVAFKTPVPGIGGITSAMLAKNLIRACKLQNNLD